MSPLTIYPCRRCQRTSTLRLEIITARAIFLLTAPRMAAARTFAQQLAERLAEGVVSII